MQLLLLLVLLVLLPPLSLAKSVNSKRGFVASGTTGSNARTCSDPHLLSTSGWYYDYNVQASAHIRYSTPFATATYSLSFV